MITYVPFQFSAAAANCIVFQVDGDYYASTAGDRDTGGTGTGGHAFVAWYDFDDTGPEWQYLGPNDAGASTGGTAITLVANEVLLIGPNDNTPAVFDSDNWEFSITFTATGATGSNFLKVSFDTFTADVLNGVALDTTVTGSAYLKAGSGFIEFGKEYTTDGWTTSTEYYWRKNLTLNTSQEYDIVASCIAGVFSLSLDGVTQTPSTETGSWYLFPIEIAAQLDLAPLRIGGNPGGYMDGDVRLISYIDCGVEAALTWFEDENTSPSETVTGDPVTMRATWQGFITPTNKVEFEETDYSVTDPADGLVMICNGITGTVSTPSLGSVVEANNGRFNTTSGGSQLLELGGATWLATITFDAPVAFFGCYITDMGDFTGQVTMVLKRTGGGTVVKKLDHSINGSSGALYFVGFIDTGATYDAIMLSSSSDAEGIGLDSVEFGPASDLA